MPTRARVFISYKRHSDPDEKIALQVYDALSRDHDVFMDQAMKVGTRWGEQIEAELRKSDFLVTFLSSHSILSEMVRGEIEMAHGLSKELEGRPSILPVRVAFTDPYPYPISAYLNPIQWAYCSGLEDTERLIEKLRKAVERHGLPTTGPLPKLESVPGLAQVPQPQPQAQPIALENPEGTICADSKFYIKRESDQIAQTAIKRQGTTITIKGPRQMGKSSLLNRTMVTAAEEGKQVVFLDFQLIEKACLADADRFYRQFCSWITDELELEDRVDEYWDNPLGNSQRCTRYVGRYLLPKLKRPLMLAMDEVESVFDTDFRTDFFTMLRSWHNSRAMSPRWKRLDLTLVTSTEPYQLIDNLNQSPFNVGEVIELEDLSVAQVELLNNLHGSPLNEQELAQLMALIDGHPYLVRRALYLVAGGRLSVSALFTNAYEDRGPFGDHLRYHLFRMHDKEQLVRGLRNVIVNNVCADDHVFFRLRGAGLVKRDGRVVVPRCQLYANYFREHLHEY